jgi:chromosome segregation ATPase
MSKEKNLTSVKTINGYHGPCVDPQKHVYSREEYHEPNDPFEPYVRRVSIPPIEGLFGPAIDRLYEFEKLGMEPEEIEKLLENNQLKDRNIHSLVRDMNELRSANRKMYDENRELERRLKNVQHALSVATNSLTQQRTEIDELRSMNQKQYDNIAELQKEIAEREKVEGASYGEIGQLSELVRLQRNAIDGYVDSNADLRKKLSRSVESNKALQKQIEYYQDKLKEINRVLEEDQ